MKIQEIRVVRKYITIQTFFWKELHLPVNSKRHHEYFGGDERQYGLTQCKKAIFCLVCFIWKSSLVIQRDWTNKTIFFYIWVSVHHKSIIYNKDRCALYSAHRSWHLYRIYSIPTHDKHQWLLLQFIVLLMMEAKSVRNM